MIIRERRRLARGIRQLPLSPDKGVWIWLFSWTDSTTSWRGRCGVETDLGLDLARRSPDRATVWSCARGCGWRFERGPGSAARCEATIPSPGPWPGRCQWFRLAWRLGYRSAPPSDAPLRSAVGSLRVWSRRRRVHAGIGKAVGERGITDRLMPARGAAPPPGAGRPDAG